MPAPLQQVNASSTITKQDIIPTNFAIKFVDANINRSITIEPNQPTIILLDLKKNIITQVR